MKYDVVFDGDGCRVGSQRYIGDHIDLDGINDSYNVKVKHYPNGRFKRTVADRKVFRVKTVSHVKPREHAPTEAELLYRETRKAMRGDNLERARQRIYDIIQCNQDKFKYFVTITFDDSKVNARNAREVVEKMQNWLKNQVKRKGLVYVLLPEYHPSSGRIHFHALVNDALKVVDSGTREVMGFSKPVKVETIQRLRIPSFQVKGTVYNLPEFHFGYTTAVELYGEILRVLNYIRKYMTKDSTSIFGKYYWYSRNLQIYPDIELYNDAALYRDTLAPEHYNPDADVRFKYEEYNTEVII